MYHGQLLNELMFIRLYVANFAGVIAKQPSY